MSAWLAFQFAFRIVSTLYKWQIRRSAHVQRALLVNAFGDMRSLAPERVKGKYVSEHIAKVVQCITCAAGASILQSLATSLTRFAKPVSAGVALALAAALAVTTQMGAEKTVSIQLIQKVGADHVQKRGLVPNADV